MAAIPPKQDALPANLPPDFPAATVTPEAAKLGWSYVATLPRFVDPEGGTIAITVDGQPPPGIGVFWKPDGTVQFSGIATTAGTYPFRLVARDPAGGTTLVPVTLSVIETGDNPIRILPPGSDAVPPAPQDTDVAALPPPEAVPDKPVEVPPPEVPRDRTVLGFLSAFEGGACFFARPLTTEVASAHIEGFGSAVEGFQRLESSFMKDFGAEPRIDVRLVAAGQCPAVEFLDGLGSHRHDARMIALDSYEVGGSVRLSGRVVGVPSGALTVLLVDNDGVAYRLDPMLKPTADGASFSIPIEADAASKGVPQLLLAIATAEPLASLPASAPAAELFPNLAAELAGSGADVTVDAAMFKVGG